MGGAYRDEHEAALAAADRLRRENQELRAALDTERARRREAQSRAASGTARPGIWNVANTVLLWTVAVVVAVGVFQYFSDRAEQRALGEKVREDAKNATSSF